MTQKEVDGNKLIAEFRGYRVVKESRLHSKYPDKTVEEYKTYINDDCIRVTPASWCDNVEQNCWDRILLSTKYHSSWDWLMPVVNKIRSLYNSAEIDICYYAEDIISKIAEGCVEANFLQVYESVIEFITHYNKIKINEKIN